MLTINSNVMLASYEHINFGFSFFGLGYAQYKSCTQLKSNSFCLKADFVQLHTCSCVMRKVTYNPLIHDELVLDNL